MLTNCLAACAHLSISLFVLAQLQNVTDRQTDGQTPGDSIYRAYAYASRGKNRLFKTESNIDEPPFQFIHSPHYGFVCGRHDAALRLNSMHVEEVIAAIRKLPDKSCALDVLPTPQLKLVAA